jgi:3-oxoacyl-[acyl-carrier protein] reductase
MLRSNEGEKDRVRDIDTKKATSLRTFEGEHLIALDRTHLMDSKLTGRKALVTGASRGIGKAIAEKLAEEGADVAMNYRSSEDEADLVAIDAESVGANTWTYRADISHLNEVREMKAIVEKYFGKIDILVNNAGINIDMLFKRMDQESWNKVIQVNLNGAFNCTSTFLDHLLESKHGRIINITSIVGQMGNIGQVNYAASKAGLIGMTKSLARELASNNITVNAIAPGFIETDMVKLIPDKVKEKVLAQIPMRRFGLPEEIAEAVVYLASDDASYITGHILNINGGMYL